MRTAGQGQQGGEGAHIAGTFAPSGKGVMSWINPARVSLEMAEQHQDAAPLSPTGSTTIAASALAEGCSSLFRA